MANDMPSDEQSTDTPSERRMTTDPERIKEWAEARDAVPVTVRDSEDHGHSFARRDDLTDDHEEYTWDEFIDAFQDDDLVFIYHEDESTAEGLGHFELVERERAFERADLGRNELEDQLREGKTVTTEIVETQVVETEVVERDTIESEVVDTELAERHVVDSELLNREIVDTEFVTADEIEVITEESRLDTIEEVERYTIESKVVDVDVDQHDELESEKIETGIELESVQRSILESDVVRTDVTADDVIEQGVIRSNRDEGDAVHSELIERRTIEEQIDERTRMIFTLEETELLDSEVIGTDVIEGEIIDVEEYGEIETIAEAGGAGAGAGMGTGTEATGEPDVEVESGTGTSTADTGDMGGAGRIELSEDDQGKDVVDETGEQIGIVAEVEGQTAYVDPEPGLTDRLKARMNWGGGHDDEDYPIEASEINEINNDEVIVQHSGNEDLTDDEDTTGI
ncbi:hypothetical protein [Haloterrigena alkaliphila]|uniref:DUF2382 domain-containing protein n=1 Tax=Haloterrigena alkaliphila TaxID=2816475 RepID=A0A8A2V867_9EURY|nr:hypothetical protein [Haloterrigena alkaliphila]QSW98073.1 hypothetical protein J0X25_11690 [Haloterrigena alkaliphila]